MPVTKFLDNVKGEVAHLKERLQQPYSAARASNVNELSELGNLLRMFPTDTVVGRQTAPVISECLTLLREMTQRGGPPPGGISALVGALKETMTAVWQKRL